jgi:hypothetical protein
MGMAEQPGERRVTAEVWENLVRLVPEVDPDLVLLIVGSIVYGTAGGRINHEGQRDGGGEEHAEVRQELVKLLSLIRDAGFDRAKLNVILGLTLEAVPVGNDDPHAPTR